MKTIYCISSGSYSDWHISYAFESKEKRDGMLKILNDEDYTAYDIDLDDDKINIDEVKNMYTCSAYKDDDFYVKKHIIINNEKVKNNVYIYGDEIYSYKFEISKEQYENPDKYTDVFSKIFKDKQAEVKYMLEVEGMSCEEVMETLNK